VAFWVNDDIVLWRLNLCAPCQLKGFEEFLSDRVNYSLSFVKWSPVMLLGSILGFWLCRLIMRFEGATKMEDLGSIGHFVLGAAGIALTVLLLVAILGAPFHLLRYVFDSRTLKALADGASLPPGRAGEAFIGEGSRIIKVLEKGQPDAVHGVFPLPRFKNLREHPEHSSKTGHQAVNRSHSVLVVAATERLARDALAPEWRDLLR
jgi:hypothetical protein